MTSLTVNPDYKLIGNNIKQMRTKSQVSQQSLAKAPAFLTSKTSLSATICCP